jgi:hypothetical protein
MNPEKKKETSIYKSDVMMFLMKGQINNMTSRPEVPTK